MINEWYVLCQSSGAVPSPDAMIGSLSGKPRPLPPPGLAVSSEDGRIGIKGVESKLEKVRMTMMFMMDILVYCMYMPCLEHVFDLVIKMWN